MSVIQNKYYAHCNPPYATDIYQHLPTLRALAQECSTIAELGVRGVVSTWAFLQGLSYSKNQNTNKTIYCVDIEDVPDMVAVAQIAKQEANINLHFFKHDSATLTLPTPVELLFIDTWHIYAHLKRELAQHHQNVSKYIAMHDTEVDKIIGESIRIGCDIAQQSKQSGYPVEEISKGLGPAIEEFLAEHSDTWELHRHYTNNNGLTILKRKDYKTPKVL